MIFLIGLVLEIVTYMITVNISNENTYISVILMVVSIGGFVSYTDLEKKKYIYKISKNEYELIYK